MKNNSAILLLILAVGLFYTFTNNQYQEARRLHTLASEFQNILQNISAVQELRDRLLITYEALPQNEIDRLNKILPDNLNTVELAFNLDNIAARHGISIERIQVSTGPDVNADAIALPDTNIYGKVTASLEFVSNYDNFINFLSDLERNLRLMDVRGITFRTTESGLYDYQLSLETYWLK